MKLQSEINSIISQLHESGIIERPDTVTHNTAGTTDGQVYTLTVEGEPKYVLKFDRPKHLGFVDRLHKAYEPNRLLSQLIYTDPDNKFIVYTYIAGITHVNRGSKIDWLSRLVTDLLNHYEVDQHTKEWGRLELPRDSWRTYNEISLEYAKNNVGDLLPIDDYEKMKSLLDNIAQVDRKYLMHGDMGVHNFVFENNSIKGVIDPAPMVGPVLYDFTYAFCSSPDDLNTETLYAAFELLQHETVDRTRLIEEVVFQLYCRIGICKQVHPHDLEGYLKAWDYWKALLP